MKRDIRITYGKIEDIITKLSTYETSLTTMKKTVISIKKNLKSSESKAIKALLDNFTVANDDIETCQKEIRDVKKILSDYINDMREYSTAINDGKLMQVDRNDIYWNINSIASSYDGKISDAKWMGQSHYGSYSKDEDVIRNEESNASKIDQLNAKATKTKNRLDSYVEMLRDIHKKKVIPFENTDDAYKSKAWDLYWKYTGFGDWVGDFFKFLVGSIIDLVAGILDALVDLVKGLFQLAAGIIIYLGSGIVVLVTSPFGAAPDWATSNVDNTHNTISSILKDPMSLVEGIAQGASDAVDTKGICYASGYIVGSLIGIKGMDKLGKAVKAGIGGAKSGIAINSVDDLAKVGYSKDVLAKMGINSSDDIVRLGLDSIDDLERLKAKLLELEKGAKIKLKGDYSIEYANKLQNIYKKFKAKGYELSEHSLNRIQGRINQGKIASIDDVMNALEKGTKYTDTVNGGTVIFKDGISVHIAEDGTIKTVIGNAKVKSTWEVYK